MQAQLIIFLHAHDLTHPSWVVRDGLQQVIKTVLQGDAEQLVLDARDCVVTVVVPAEDVLLTTVTLPKMNRSRLMQAIPFALEEHLIEDVDTMHFAVGEYRANAPLAVAVTARSKMSEWMSLLQIWHIVPDTMISGVFALPDVTPAWHASVSDVAVVRTGSIGGFACDRDNLAEFMSLALSGAEVSPTDVEIQNCGAPLNLSLPVPVKEVLVSSEQMLAQMAAEAEKGAQVTLLQGNYLNKKSRRMPKLTSVLRTSVYLFAAWLVLLFLYPVISFAILDGRTKDIKKEIAVIYHRQFPDASSVVAPKERMQQKLSKLSSGFDENRLLLLMANIGKGLSHASGLQLKRMDYQGNQMTLEITAASSDVFAEFTDALTQQGLHVKQQNANLDGARVSATLQIE